MLNKITEKEIYSEINAVSEKNGVVFCGTDLFSELPVGELKNLACTDCAVLNRSMPGAALADLESVLPATVEALAPRKVFLNIGENDLAAGNFDLTAFLAGYEALIGKLRATAKHAKFYVVSVLSDDEKTAALNEALRTLAARTRCTYVDLTPALKAEKPVLRMLDLLRFHVRDRAINFCDAMNLARPVTGV